MRHRHGCEVRIHADAAGEDAGIGDQHVARPVEPALLIDHTFAGVCVDRIAALRMRAGQRYIASSAIRSDQLISLALVPPTNAKNCWTFSTT